MTNHEMQNQNSFDEGPIAKQLVTQSRAALGLRAIDDTSLTVSLLRRRLHKRRWRRVTVGCGMCVLFGLGLRWVGSDHETIGKPLQIVESIEKNPVPQEVVSRGGLPETNRAPQALPERVPTVPTQRDTYSASATQYAGYANRPPYRVIETYQVIVPRLPTNSTSVQADTPVWEVREVSRPVSWESLNDLQRASIQRVMHGGMIEEYGPDL